MAKQTTRTRKPRAAKSAAKAAPAAAGGNASSAAAQPLQGDSGAEAKPGGAAAPSGGAEAGSESIIVTGPKNGRWRSGLYFGPEPTTLQPEDLVAPPGERPSLADKKRLHAILTDPRLRCVVVLGDGTQCPFPQDAVAALGEAIAAEGAE